MLQWGKMGQTNYAAFDNLLGYLYGKYVYMIGLKAPWNYSDQFWFNKISILLCEGPKPPTPMISSFMDPL